MAAPAAAVGTLQQQKSHSNKHTRQRRRPWNLTKKLSSASPSSKPLLASPEPATTRNSMMVDDLTGSIVTPSPSSNGIHISAQRQRALEEAEQNLGWMTASRTSPPADAAAPAISDTVDLDDEKEDSATLARQLATSPPPSTTTTPTQLNMISPTSSEAGVTTISTASTFPVKNTTTLQTKMIVQEEKKDEFQLTADVNPAPSSSFEASAANASSKTSSPPKLQKMTSGSSSNSNSPFLQGLNDNHYHNKSLYSSSSLERITSHPSEEDEEQVVPDSSDIQASDDNAGGGAAAAFSSSSSTGTSLALTSGTAMALEYSAKACECLQEEDLSAALKCYQRALLVYQQAQAPLGIVDTCNAAATLHNMGAVYNALEQSSIENDDDDDASATNYAEEALQCYHDAEQLYRECQERLKLASSPEEHSSTPQQLLVTQEMAWEDLVDVETVCLTALIAETLHHRAAIYSSSQVIWDDLACLECHEACLEILLPSDNAENDHNQGATAAAAAASSKVVRVTCIDDVYFQHDCPPAVRMEWLIESYEELSKLYRNSDTPQDSLVVLQAWQSLAEEQLQQHRQQHSIGDDSNKDAASVANDDVDKWRKSLAECWKQLSEYYFSQEEMSLAADALHNAMDLQLQMNSAHNHSNNTAEYAANSRDSAVAVPSLDTTTNTTSEADSEGLQLLHQMNSMGLLQEERGNYDEALACYEKVLLLTSRNLGEDHWEVAETLVKIGRVMEQQGNVAGGLDLYHAAHTIYQAAVKNSYSAVQNNDGDCRQPQSAETEEEAELSTTRAATESVVRIANVLMSQKRWQEAVDFLTELPQAKEWLSWLGGRESSTVGAEDKTSLATTSVTPASPKPSTTTEAPPSVDQAIVFRELGRAYMGMGSLTKAKQCLLESARRLEGTDYEEDVFELLMHVEFRQKQGQKAAQASANSRRRHRRSRSGSRSRRARSQSSRRSRGNSSTGERSTSLSEEEKTRITKAAVAAVLSPSASASASGCSHEDSGSTASSSQK
jgi:tetratricopeptide (TPR) repeat protein